MAVEAPVSSRNTSFDTSPLSCHSRHSALASFISSPSRSLANSVFFIAPTLRTDQTAQRCIMDFDATVFAHVSVPFRLAPVPVICNQRFDEISFVLQFGAKPAPDRQRFITPPVPPIF